MKDEKETSYRDQATTERIENDFKYHAPQPDQIPRYEAINESARLLAHTINKNCPNSREKSTSLTLLDQVRMMANAAVARNPTQVKETNDAIQTG